MNKYVVSLTADARRANRFNELRAELEKASGVEVVETGRNAFTISTTAAALATLRQRLSYANFEPHRTLKLLHG